jgi:hypothetical protein
MNKFDKLLIFKNFPAPKACSRDSIIAYYQDQYAKRIHFASSHKDALKKNNSGTEGGRLVLPFSDSIFSIITTQGYQLRPSKFGGVWLPIKTDAEYSLFEDFIEKYRDIVFLRDGLDLSFALSMNIDENDERTEIGVLEYRAKYHCDKDSESKLVEITNEWINKLSYLRYADYICAMPGNKGDNKLPMRIVACLSGFCFEDISNKVFFVCKTKSLKDADSIEGKLQVLDTARLVIDPYIDLQGKNVLLFDDLYQSGVSMQYVTMRLKEAGAERVFGLSLVKSRSNTVNYRHNESV